MSDGITAIDVGTSRVKGAAFDRRGQVTDFAEAPMPPLILDGREATQDLTAVCAAFLSVWQRLERKRPGALALTTQRGTGIAVGSKHEPLGPLISWLDRRPRAELAGPQGLRSLHAHLALMLCGRALETTQTGTASGTVEIVPIGTVVDMHVSPGTKLVVCGGDKNSELVGAGCFEAGRACLSLGTAISLGTLAHGMTADPPRTFTTSAHVFGLKQIEVGLPFGGGILPWLERTLGAEACRSLGSVAPDGDGPLFLPYLAGSLSDSQASARWTRVTGETTPTALATAAMAGIVLDVWNQVDVLPAPLSGVTVVGGGSQCPYLVQWFADALGVPLVLRKRADAGLAGAAMVAATALGQAKDWAEASLTYGIPEAARISPDAGRAGAWKRLLERFRAELGCISGSQKL